MYHGWENGGFSNRSIPQELQHHTSWSLFSLQVRVAWPQTNFHRTVPWYAQQNETPASHPKPQPGPFFNDLKAYGNAMLSFGQLRPTWSFLTVPFVLRWTLIDQVTELILHYDSLRVFLLKTWPAASPHSWTVQVHQVQKNHCWAFQGFSVVGQ